MRKADMIKKRRLIKLQQSSKKERVAKSFAHDLATPINI
jgi:hypothetical protein